MKNVLEQIKVAFGEIDNNNLKEDDTLLAICHTNEKELVTAIAGKPIEIAASIASAMSKSSDLEAVIRMAVFAFDCEKKMDSKPEDKPETEAENEK